MITNLAGRRIAIVLGSAELGGAERQAFFLGQGLRDRHRAQVAIFAMGSGTELEAICNVRGIPLYRIPRIESRFECLSLVRIICAGLKIARWSPDIVIPFTDPANRCCAIARQVIGAELTVWNQRDAGQHRGGALIEHFALQRSHLLVANGPEGFQHLTTLTHGDRNIHIIANGVEIPQTQTNTLSLPDIPNDRPLVALVAHLHPRKGHDLALLAWQELCATTATNQPRPLLLCIGRDDGLGSTLRQRAKSLNIANDVRFLGLLSDPQSILSRCCLALSASPSEGCPNAVLEAMAVGLPIVGWDLPVMRWVLPPMQHAALAAKQDPKDLAQRLRLLLADAVLARRCGHENRQRIQTWTVDRMVNCWARLLSNKNQQIHRSAQISPSAQALAFLIPTRNRHDSLNRTLPSVLAAAQRHEVITLICDQSETPYPDIRSGHLLHCPDLRGLPAARNILLAHSEADLVCFLDDDTDLAPNFADHAIALAKAQPDVVAWGPIVETRSRWTRRMHRLVHLGAFSDPRRQTARRRDGDTSALFGCCFVVRRSAALATGFDGRRPGYALGEDFDFFKRLPGRKRFVAALRAHHRRDGHNRADPYQRGIAKACFLRWIAARHGGHNPATLIHLGLALVVAALGFGQEPAAWSGVWKGCLRTGLRNGW